MKQTAILLLILVLVVSIAGCGKSAYGENAVSPKKDTVIGNLKKDGLEVSIPAGAFEKEVKVSVTKAAEDGEAFTAGKDTFLTMPIEIGVEEMEGVRLNQPVKITMKLDKNKLPDAESFDRYVMAYWTGEEWEPIIPDPARLEKGYLEFETWHFSAYASKEMTQDEQIKLYAHKMAVEKWSNESVEPTMREKLEAVCNDYLDSAKISDNDVRDKIIRRVKTSNDFGILYLLAAAGDVAAVGAKCTEIIVQATVDVCAENPLALEIVTAATGTVGELAKGSLALYDGDYKTAISEFTAVGTTLLGYGTIGQAKTLIELTAAAVEQGVMGWKDYELECAYKAYAGLASENTYGYKLNQGDWETLMIQMRGYYNQLVRERKDAYKEIGGKTGLTAEESAMIERQVETELRRKFEARAANEKLIAERQAEYEKIIQSFKDNKLLSRLDYGYKSSMSVEDRLRSLFSIRQNILDIVGGDISVFGKESKREDNLSWAIAQWLTFGKDRAKFYQWMRENGYLPEQKETKGYWEQTGIIDKPVDVSKVEKSEYYSSSWNYGHDSYTYRCEVTYDGVPYTGKTHDSCKGEYVSSTGTFSTPKKQYLGGEKVVLHMNITAQTSNPICFNLGASISANITSVNKDDPFAAYGTDASFWDIDEKIIKSYLWTEKNDTNTGYYGMEADFGATMPSGSNEGDKVYIIVGMGGGNEIMQTAYEYTWHIN